MQISALKKQLWANAKVRQIHSALLIDRHYSICRFVNYLYKKADSGVLKIIPHTFFGWLSGALCQDVTPNTCYQLIKEKPANNIFEIICIYPVGTGIIPALTNYQYKHLLN